MKYLIFKSVRGIYVAKRLGVGNYIIMGVTKGLYSSIRESNVGITINKMEDDIEMDVEDITILTQYEI